MSPIAVHSSNSVDIAALKAKVVNNHLEIGEERKGPVADDFMYDFKYIHALPTIGGTACAIPQDLDAGIHAEGLVELLESTLSSNKPGEFSDLFLEHGVWRDKLIFTWDYRTFNFRENIYRAASNLLSSTTARDFKLIAPRPSIQRPYPDLHYLQFCASFGTEIAYGSAVVNAVLTPQGWKLWTVHTVIEGLREFPEIDPLDGHMTGPIGWEKQREKDVDETQPDVLIVGGGQNGLQLAARLKALGVAHLVIEKSDIIGEVWRKRYEYLSLHFPHWADHFPYFPFPEHWPTYTSAQKLGVFMEWYASALELSVWTSSSVIDAVQDDAGLWTVEVNKGGTEKRVLHPKHLVMATSLCGVPMVPIIPGSDIWQGVARHSTAHDSSRDWLGKRVLVVGTSSSGFDTAFDCARRDIDVTILQRSPTYVMSLTHSVPRIIGGYAPVNGVRPDIEAQDRLAFAMPVGPGEELGRRQAKVLEELDRDLLDGLHAKGFKTWRGQRGTGNSTLGQTRNGGFYFEAGACEQIINGKIKVEQGYIERFTKDKVILSGGRETTFDLVIYATGFSNTIDSVRQILGEKIARGCGDIWGIDEEGEFRSAYKESGVTNLWIFVGYLPYTRFHSKRLALRLKALIEGIAPTPYKA